MKTKAFALGLAVSFLAVSAVFAADNDQKTTTKSAPTKAKVSNSGKNETKKDELTGSYLKRKVHKHGEITDGPSQVYVLDNDSIRRSGASDVSQLLLRRGFRR